jgi:GNAT superfamily N-acetyltransferase
MRVLPLAGSHDRKGFDCGRPELNDWLSRMARQHQEKGLSKTFVAIDEANPFVICAYYALTLTEIDSSLMPADKRNKFPRRIPGVRLARLAVSLSHQKKGLGELLLVNALERASAFIPKLVALVYLLMPLTNRRRRSTDTMALWPRPSSRC